MLVSAQRPRDPHHVLGPRGRPLHLARLPQGRLVILDSGCHIGDCHYIDANHWTAKRIEKVRKKMGWWTMGRPLLLNLTNLNHISILIYCIY